MATMIARRADEGQDSHEPAPNRQYLWPSCIVANTSSSGALPSCSRSARRALIASPRRASRPPRRQPRDGLAVAHDSNGFTLRPRPATDRGVARLRLHPRPSFGDPLPRGGFRAAQSEPRPTLKHSLILRKHSAPMPPRPSPPDPALPAAPDLAAAVGGWLRRLATRAAIVRAHDRGLWPRCAAVSRLPCRAFRRSTVDPRLHRLRPGGSAGVSRPPPGRGN